MQSSSKSLSFIKSFSSKETSKNKIMFKIVTYSKIGRIIDNSTTNINLEFCFFNLREISYRTEML